MLTYIQPIYIFILALILAILEVQIEGAHGWAKNLPTWRAKPNKWYAKIYKKITGDKDLTGYHLCLFSFIFVLFHSLFFFGIKWNIMMEIKIISLFILFMIIEDYLWFVVNPYFTVKNFQGKHIIWHKKWFLKLPLGYWIGVLISFFLAGLNYLIFQENILNWLINLILLIILTILTKEFIKKFKPEWE